MIKHTFSATRMTLLRMVVFWTLLLSVLLTAASDLSLGAAVTRFIYWVLHIGLGLIAAIMVTRWLQGVWLSRLGDWGQLAASSVAAVAVFTPVGLALDLLVPDSFGPAGHADLESEAREQGIWSAAIDELGSFAPTVIAVWLIVHLTYRFFNPTNMPEPPKATALDAQSTSDTAVSGIYERLPPALGTDIVFMRSDANYIHVHTLLGKTMFLYSLANAAQELAEVGLLVHRSYWVGIDHVESVKRQGSQTVCVMADGSTVPVSRRRQQTLHNHFGKNFVRVT